jgi:hypothetical protein
MQDFMEGRYNVLLCSTIKENGLDIATANVNTLFVLETDPHRPFAALQCAPCGSLSGWVRIHHVMRDLGATEVAQKP